MKEFSKIIRRQSGQMRVAIFMATVLVSLTPFWLARNHSPLLSNKALAAYDATDRAVIMQEMSHSERAHYGRTVRDLLVKDPGSFLNLVEDDLVMALSMPALKRTDGSVQIWQYRSGACVLDVFIEGNTVVHYEFRSPGKAVLRAQQKEGAAAPEGTACMKTLVRT